MPIFLCAWVKFATQESSIILPLYEILQLMVCLSYRTDVKVKETSAFYEVNIPYISLKLRVKGPY